jgi:hypothetical protein
MVREVTMSRWTGVVVAALALQACASAGSLKEEPIDVGVERQYTATLVEGMEAARNACVGAQMQIEEIVDADPQTSYVICKKSGGWTSWGELVRVLVQQTGPDAIAIRVFTKKKVSVNVTARDDWSGPIFEQIEAELVKATGNPLARPNG